MCAQTVKKIKVPNDIRAKALFGDCHILWTHEPEPVELRAKEATIEYIKEMLLDNVHDTVQWNAAVILATGFYSGFLMGQLEVINKTN